jgi:two-component system, cell cycle sensor histidine kinase and response regulator CckA
MSRPIRVLILEDNPNDAELMVFELRRSGFPPTWDRVETEADFLAHLDAGLDVILADYSLPQFDGMRALRLVRERNLDVPFIVVTGALGDEKAAECVKQGAVDYLMKDRLARLGPAVAHALDQRRLRDDKHGAEGRIAYQAQVLSGVHDAVIAVDNLQVITAWNPAAERVYGWPADEAIGRNADELLQSGYATLARSDVIQRLLRDGFIETGVRQRCKDGRLIEVETHLVVLRNEAGQVVGYVAANRDITERKRIEAELARHQAQLEKMIEERTRALDDVHGKLLSQERLAAVGQIAGNVAGQLRAPLAMVLDSVSLMKLMGSSRFDEKTNRQLVNVEEAVERCNHVVTSLLDFARARPPEPTRCSLTYLVTEALAEADLPLAIKRKIQIPDRIPPVYTDRLQIMRVLVNVFDNARDAFGEGLRVQEFKSLRVQESKSGNGGRGGETEASSSSGMKVITISATASGTTVELTVNDNGPGISPEVRKRLFEPLFTTRDHGAGLGLAIARNFVEANKGSIRVESEPRSGTTVVISLPTA